MKKPYKKEFKKKSKHVLGRKPHKSVEMVFKTDKAPFKEMYVVDDFTSHIKSSVKN